MIHFFENILRTQKRCLRIMYNQKRLEKCKPIFKQERILTVINLYIFEKRLQIFDNIGSYKRCAEVHHYNTRNKDNLTISAKSDNKMYQASIIFNNLPLKLKLMKSKSAFKKHLKAARWLDSITFKIYLTPYSLFLQPLSL